MDHQVKLSILATSLALMTGVSAYAAEPISLQHTSFEKIQQHFHVMLPGKQNTMINAADSLKFMQEHTDKNNKTHIRMQQEYAGYLVFGGYAILHSTKPAQRLAAALNDSTVTMNGKLYQGLEDELGTIPNDLSEKADKALLHYKAQFDAMEVSEEEIIPIIYMDENNQAHWAFKVSFYVRYSHKIPERPTAILDATTLKPFMQWNDIKTVRQPVKGIGFGGNQKIGELGYGREMPHLNITRTQSSGKCYMENKDVRIVDMRYRYVAPNKAMSFSCRRDAGQPDVYWTGYSGDGYDSINGAFSPSNDALYAGEIIKHLYHDWYGVEVLRKSNGAPMQLVMRVHYGDGYENAYWDGKQMTFGDGAKSLYPLVSLGIGGHEVSHGFTEQHSGLVYKKQSGGINESFSDMASQAAEYYSLGRATWRIGAEIMKESSGLETLRYMDTPSKDHYSIDTADKYNDEMDVHHSSGVFNRMFYLLSTRPGWDPRKAFDVMVKANMDYWTPYETYKTAACGILLSAQDLGYPLVDVQTAFDTVLVDYSLCKLS